MKNTVVDYPLTKQPKSKKKYHHYTFKQIRIHKHIHVQGIDHNQLKVSLTDRKPERMGFVSIPRNIQSSIFFPNKVACATQYIAEKARRLTS
jgi:hypothetical protein